MRALQSQKLVPLSRKGGWELLWHDSIDDIPQDSDEYTMLLAHEFFDALPIHLLEVPYTTWELFSAE
jgi:NADH dehydrogenase [ubiquinone] 1 alpha subcomplex assembly factor 7